MGLISSIRKRRLFQILAAYLAAGFIVLQGVDQLVQHGLVPPFAYPLTLWWYGIGALAALVIGWFHGEKGAQRAPMLEVVLLGFLGVFLLGLTGARLHAHLSDRAALAAAAESDMDLRRIAVTYFEDLGRGDEHGHIADALTEELIGELSRVRGLDVVSRNGVAPFRGDRVTPDEVARAVQAGTIVTGSVEPVGDAVRVIVRVHDGQSGTDLRRVSLERPFDELLDTRGEVVDLTAGLLREWLGDEITVRRRRDDTEHLAAWTLVQRAERERKEAERLWAGAGDSEEAFAAFDRADELLERAEVVDPGWVEPSVLRAQIAYRRSRLAFPPPEDAEPWILVGLEHAARSLDRMPTHPRALELRGTLRYWRYLLPLIPDPAEREATLGLARSDLEEAVRLDPTLASAYAVLAHLYAWIDQGSSSVLAARRAYEEDAYLENADEVLWRLVATLYDQESFEESRRWCEEGRVRFPQNFRFAQCRLLVMTTPAVPPDTDEAWSLLAGIDSLLPPAQRTLVYANSLTLVGGVLARANLPDSADRVLRRARDLSIPEVDPRREIFLNEAAMRANVLGDVDGAIDLLKDFAVREPDYDFGEGWWWRNVRGHPRYGELLAFQDARGR